MNLTLTYRILCFHYTLSPHTPPLPPCVPETMSLTLIHCIPHFLVHNFLKNIAGFVLYFYNFSTFVGKNGIYIEDLYVRECYRKRGYGTVLLQQLCQVAKKEDCGRIEWWCLDWNKDAIKFYTQKLQAEAMNEWTVYRLNRQKIESIANA